MTGLMRLGLTGVVLLALLAPSCSVIRKPKPAAPPPRPAPVEPAPAPKKQVELPAPPKIEPQTADLEEQQAPEVPEKFPPRPSKRPPRPVRSHEPAEAPAAAQPPAPTQPEEQVQVPLPDLEQILTPEQRQAYVEEIESDLGKAQKNVDSLQGRQLNREQRTSLARVRAFILQANEARKTDLFRARNLAERANVLAEDLLRSVQ